MSARDREYRRVAFPVVLLSALGWVALVAGSVGLTDLTHCHAMGEVSATDSLRAMLASNPVPSLATGWVLMLIAMMSPTLIAPVLHVYRRSFRHRRLRSILLFVLGYGAIWMAAGAVLTALQLILSAMAPHSYGPAVAAGLLALVWQCSPLKQRCLNRGHNHSELAAFGAAADRDALVFGITHGGWCVGSCWALMLLPMLLVQGHMLMMVAVTIVMVGERFESPGPLRWRLRGPGKLFRIVLAQTRAMRWSHQKASYG
jgi:predicted metal-binding membrane protein